MQPETDFFQFIVCRIILEILLQSSYFYPKFIFKHPFKSRLV